MSQSEAQHVIEELSRRFEPRFDQLDNEIKGLKHRMLTLEDAVDDMRDEQKLIRQAAVSNLRDITRITDRLEARSRPGMPERPQ